MEASDWASLSDFELLERRIAKLGWRVDATALKEGRRYASETVLV